uniref:Ig-like domain-containing protein n=1 Tax=Amphilophus citrinellus TaxID=61819 RepID=A0A3Q0SSB6_AMPCI
NVGKTVLLPLTFPFSDQKFIPAESGRNVTLPCRAPNSNISIIVTEWSRADLEKEYVLLYRDEQFDPDYQHPSFKDRVDLQDRQMKDGDVSVILKNVTVNDTGTYECRVFQRGKNRGKRAHLMTAPISIIYLRVVDPPAASWLLMFDKSCIVVKCRTLQTSHCTNPHFHSEIFVEHTEPRGEQVRAKFIDPAGT